MKIFKKIKKIILNEITLSKVVLDKQSISKHFSKKLNTKQGVATLEMLIAMAIMVLAISAVTLLLFSSQSISIGTQTNQEALYKAQQAIENARATARANFNDPSLNPGSTVTTDASGITYTKNLTITKIDDFTKNINSLITWGTSGQYVTLSTTVTDWQSAVGGDTCSQTLTGDWTQPTVYGYVDFPSSTGATGVDAIGTKAYVVSDPRSSGTDDFYVIDITDPTQKPLPILGHFSTSYGLTDVHTAGTYAYVTADSASYQLLVIDVSDPTTLSPAKIVGKKDMTVPSDTAYGNTLFYLDKKVYVGLTLSSGPEFHIFDVSNPTNPVELGSGYEVGAAVNKILVKNNIAYLTTAANNEVIALNVSNPASPTFVGAYNSATLTGQSMALDKTNNTLYFGKIGGIGNPKLLALDSTNLSGTPKWTMDMIKQSGIYTLILRSNLLFMTTADPSDGLQIWDVSNPSGPPVRHDTSPLNIQQNATAGTDCAGNFLYVAQKSNRAMQIVGPYVPSTYALSNSGDISAVQGSSGNNTITATITSGTPGNKTFAASGLPAGASASFGNSPCTPTCASSFTITTTLATPVGTYPITVTGTGGMTTTFNLNVSLQSFDYTLSNSGNITVTQGNSGGNTITRTLTSGATQPVTVSASGLPAGATAVFSFNPCSATCSSSLTITTAAATPVGTYPITVTGTGGKTTTFNLVVNAPFDYTLSNSGNFSVVRKNSASNTITRTLVSGITQGVTLNVTSVLPTGVTTSFTSGTCNPTCSSTFTVTTKQTTPLGSFSITITGTPNGTGPRSTTFTVTVTP